MRDAKETLENFWESCQRQIQAAGEVEELVRELCAKVRADQTSKEEADCHNCACSVWYSREDGDVTWLCIREQPEKSVRVTLPNICCEYWRARGEN